MPIGSSHTYVTDVREANGSNVACARQRAARSPVSSTVPAYQQAVVADNPTFFWRLGEAGGTVAADSSGGLRGGIYTGGIGYGQPGQAVGQPSGAVTTNGSDGLITTSTPGPSPSTFSVEAWIKTTTTLGGKIIGFGIGLLGLDFGGNPAVSSNYDKHMYMRNDGRLTFGVWVGFADTSHLDCRIQRRPMAPHRRNPRPERPGRCMWTVLLWHRVGSPTTSNTPATGDRGDNPAVGRIGRVNNSFRAPSAMPRSIPRHSPRRRWTTTTAPRDEAPARTPPLPSRPSTSRPDGATLGEGSVAVTAAASDAVGVVSVETSRSTAPSSRGQLRPAALQAGRTPRRVPTPWSVSSAMLPATWVVPRRCNLSRETPTPRRRRRRVRCRVECGGRRRFDCRGPAASDDRGVVG